MKISSVETALYQVPRQPGMSNSTTRIESTSLLLARVTTDEGVTGTGWTYSHGNSGVAMKAAIDTLFAERLLGQDPADVERLWDSLWKSVFPNITMAGLTTVALAPVDIALWDIAAKAAGKPLFRILGNHRESVPCYGSGLDLAYSLEELLDEVEGFMGRGFGG